MADQTTEPHVTATRYTVSLFPLDDDNCLPYALFVQHSRKGWGITDGLGWVEGYEGHTGYWHLDSYEALLFADLNDALALARKLAPFRTAKGMTATEACRRAYPDTARQASGQQPDTGAAPWIADGRHGPTPEEMADARIPTCYVQFMGGAHCATAPAAGLSDTQPANGLRDVIAHAIHRYDNHHALTGNDVPSAHHYGEADAVLAALGKTTWTVEEDETR